MTEHQDRRPECREQQQQQDDAARTGPQMTEQDLDIVIRVNALPVERRRWIVAMIVV